MRELVEGRGCDLLFLPAYSPDFSPIEEAFSKIKTLMLKKRKEIQDRRTVSDTYVRRLLQESSRRATESRRRRARDQIRLRLEQRSSGSKT